MAHFGLRLWSSRSRRSARPTFPPSSSNSRATAAGLILGSARAVQSTDDRSREHLHASLALLPVDATQVDYLFNRLLTATPSELPVLRDALKAHRSTLTPKLWTVLESAKPGDASLLPAASALASYDPDDARWEAVGGKVAQALVTVNSIFLGPWLEALRPVRGKLTAPLATIFQDKDRPETEHYAGDEHPRRLRQRRSRPARRAAHGRRPQGVS